MVEQWRDKRKRNEGSTESYTKLCVLRHKKKADGKTNWKKRFPSSSWSDHHPIKKSLPGNHSFNMRRVPSCVPSNRKMNSVPASLKQLKKDQATQSLFITRSSSSREKTSPIREMKPLKPRRRHNFNGKQEQSRIYKVQPYKRRSRGTAHHEVHPELKDEGVQDLL
ncbi:hypothetical protein TNIN_286291 [Trichonephila inaurata madagascariensis]|uniref:Uncharacterized protein n=1 Tax=Trichonephila inaurata madagascariensis TaxID=2747483 RepID=A0A8X7BYR2_9ARAC|nr:hypothetical protein TNIN_286291 [Trichonephila inaurata madagascariensis]